MSPKDRAAAKRLPKLLEQDLQQTDKTLEKMTQRIKESMDGRIKLVSAGLLDSIYSANQWQNIIRETLQKEGFIVAGLVDDVPYATQVLFDSIRACVEVYAKDAPAQLPALRKWFDKGKTTIGSAPILLLHDHTRSYLGLIFKVEGEMGLSAQESIRSAVSTVRQTMESSSEAAQVTIPDQSILDSTLDQLTASLKH